MCAVEEDQDDPWTLPPSRKKPDAPITGPLPKTVKDELQSLLADWRVSVTAPYRSTGRTLGSDIVIEDSYAAPHANSAALSSSSSYC